MTGRGILSRGSREDKPCGRFKPADTEGPSLLGPLRRSGQLGEDDDECVGDGDVRDRDPAPGQQDGDEPGALRLLPQSANRVHGVTAGKLATSNQTTRENAGTTIATSLAFQDSHTARIGIGWVDL